MKKAICSTLCAALALCSMACPVFAMEGAEPIAAPTPVPVYYPAEVRTSEENGVTHLEKIYYLTQQDDPAQIPTEDFDREGQHYTLLDLLKADQTESETKEYIEVITLDSDTKDMAQIIQLLETELEVTTDDGYHGILKPDYPSINVETAGYKTSSKTVSATRTYPNLSDADISLIPKTIEDSGRTLTLANVDWQESPETVDGDYVTPFRYTAIASYTGTAYSKNATGYTVTADYIGDVTKVSCDTVVYTAVFSGVAVSEGAASEAADFDARLLLIPAGVLGLGAAGYGGSKAYKKYQNKKRGYE